MLVTPQIVTDAVGESTVVTFDTVCDLRHRVTFDTEPGPEFRPAGPHQVPGDVRDAVAPAVEAAKAVLGKATEARPGQARMKFGIKISGAASRLVARAATEGSITVTLTWTPGPRDRAEPDASKT